MSLWSEVKTGLNSVVINRSRKSKKDVKPVIDSQLNEADRSMVPDVKLTHTKPVNHSGKSMLTSDKLAPKKKKGPEVMNLEEALKELNIKTTVSSSKKRQPCNCQGKSVTSTPCLVPLY